MRIVLLQAPHIYHFSNIKSPAPICSRSSNIPLDPNSSSAHRLDGLFSYGHEDVPSGRGAAGGVGVADALAGEVVMALEVLDVTEDGMNPAI